MKRVCDFRSCVPTLALLLTTITLLAPGYIRAGQWTAKVVHIVDGDTFDVLDDLNTSTRIRLAEVDTPEKGRPWSRKATNALKGLIAGKQVRIQVHDEDRWKRKVATVWLSDLEVNAWMIEEGHAWVYRRFAQRESLLKLEEKARAERKGLWGLPERERLNIWLW